MTKVTLIFAERKPGERDDVCQRSSLRFGSEKHRVDCLSVWPGSPGVARQWLGRFGKVDNGQVGTFLTYVTRKEHMLVNSVSPVPLQKYLHKFYRRKTDIGEVVQIG